MLSYQHNFHAGNHADVLKHLCVAYVINYMKKKDKPFMYSESHSGNGLYNLKQFESSKNMEFKDGIQKLWEDTNPIHEVQDYLKIIKYFNNNELNIYPGSPAIAKFLLRPKDSIALAELHPKAISDLMRCILPRKKTSIQKLDGYQFLNSKIPPPQNRGLVVIDPSYEIKTEYKKAPTILLELYKKWSNGVYLLWYPVVKRELVDVLQNILKQSDIKEILQIEFSVTQDNTDFGMTGSGLFIINPPWTMKKDFHIILPYLKKIISPEGLIKLDWLSEK